MRWTTIWLVTAALTAASAGGCKKDGGGANSNEILIGEYGSLTGDTATFGTSTHKGLLLAVDQLNNAGGVLGKKIRVQTEDDRSDQNEAVTAVQKLINSDNVLAIIGEVASTRSLAGGSVCERQHVPMLSPSSTNPAVTVENGKVKDYIFRICFTDDFQGKIDGKFGSEQGYKRVAILTNVDQDYSKGLAKFFKEAYGTSGSIVAEESYTKRDQDFKAQLNRVKQSNPDAVYVPGYYTEVILMLRQAKEVGLNVPFFGGDGWDSPETVKTPEAQGDFYSDHYSVDDPSPQSQEFVKAYQDKYHETPDAMAVLGYDAGRVMVDAIKRAGKADREAIKDALAQTKDFPGASGTITIDAQHNARKPIVIVRVQDNKAKLFKTYPPE